MQRGELEVIHEILGSSSVDTPLAIFTDNATNLFDINNDKSLGEDTNVLISLRRAPTIIIWVKANLGDEPREEERKAKWEAAFFKYSFIPAKLIGANALADKLAGLEADAAKLPQLDITRILRVVKDARRTQERAVMTLFAAAEAEGANLKVDKPECVKPLTPLGVAVASEHDLFPTSSKGWACAACGFAFVGSGPFLAQAFASPCRPVGRPISDILGSAVPKPIPVGLRVYVAGSLAHHTHKLHGCRGYFFCLACSAFGGARLELLGERCVPLLALRATAKDRFEEKRRCIDRLAKGREPYPGAATHRFSNRLVLR